MQTDPAQLLTDWLETPLLDRRSHILPLCELEATDFTSANYQPLNDYVVWFANR